ncbi:MAG: hypothetical protein SWK90_18530 [Chloroflexota bacterium]|nr:hypothetical protein [Chloroflexota bacterium]
MPGSGDLKVTWVTQVISGGYTLAVRHDKMVTLVERILALHRKLAAATIPADKKLYQRQIETTDRQIDALVYELYGLTEEEIGIVESLSH